MMNRQQNHKVIALQEGIEQLQRSIDTLLSFGADAWEELGRESTTVYRELEEQRNRLALVDTDFLVGSRQLRPLSEHKQVQWLVRELPITPTAARERIRAAERLNDQADPDTITSTCPEGRPHKTFMPEIREAVADGHIGNAAVSRIHHAINALPGEHHTKITQAADKPLAELVRQHGPAALNGLGMQLTRLFNLEENYSDRDRQRKRSLRLGKQEYDGMSRLNGLVTPRLAAIIQRLFADHAKAGDLAQRMQHTTGSVSGGNTQATRRAQLDNVQLDNVVPLDFNAQSDPRTPAQRAHDALEAAIADGFGRDKVEDIATSTEEFCGQDAPGQDKSTPGHESNEHKSKLFDESMYQPDVSTVPVIPTNQFLASSRLKPRRGSTSIVAVTSLEELLAGKGNAVTDTGVQISVESLVEGTNCSDVYLQVLDLTGQTLYLGRSQRLGGLAQYLALCAEEGCSSAPGTSAPPAWCDMHHVEAWEHGGETDLPNLTLVDRHTHANTVDTLGTELDHAAPDTKWQSKPGDPARGERIRWYPPADKDPARRPAENLNIAAQTTKAAELRRRRRAELRKTPEPEAGAGTSGLSCEASTATSEPRMLDKAKPPNGHNATKNRRNPAS